MLLGAALIARSAVAILGAIGLLIAALAVLVFYTYRWWRDDPDRLAAPMVR